MKKKIEELRDELELYLTTSKEVTNWRCTIGKLVDIKIALNKILQEEKGCSCKNITPQTVECYSQMITVDIPPHMDKYRKEREKAGLSAKISIDPCIFMEIWQLWQKGIITYGSCCGHNTLDSFVNVDESSIQQMIDIGYIQNHHDPERKNTFALKTT